MLYELLGFRDNEFSAGIGWHDRIAAGFPQNALWALARHLKVPSEDLAELVQFPKDALDWRNRKEPLSVDASDVLFRIAVAYHRLFALFKDAEQCTKWMRNVRKEVQNQIPVLLLTTSAGATLVYEAIDRIKPVKRVEMSTDQPDASEDDEPSDEPTQGD